MALTFDAHLRELTKFKLGQNEVAALAKLLASAMAARERKLPRVERGLPTPQERALAARPWRDLATAASSPAARRIFAACAAILDPPRKGVARSNRAGEDLFDVEVE